MSRNKDKITKALKTKGYEPIEIVWEPISGAPIMCGPEGGWYINFEPVEGMKLSDGLRSYNIMAYNINDVMEEIEKLPECISDN
jgi:hypothetical protein